MAARGAGSKLTVAVPDEHVGAVLWKGGRHPGDSEQERGQGLGKATEGTLWREPESKVDAHGELRGTAMASISSPKARSPGAPGRGEHLVVGTGSVDLTLS